MAITINGSSNTITGLAAGGLPDGSIQAADLASGVGGKLLQFARIGTSANQNLTSTYTYTDLTDLSINLTPVSASSHLWITGAPFFRLKGSTSYYGYGKFRIQHDGSTVHEEQMVYRGYREGSVGAGIVLHNGIIPIYGYVTSTGSTDARIIKLQAKNDTNSDADLTMGAYTGFGFLSVMEIAA